MHIFSMNLKAAVEREGGREEERDENLLLRSCLFIHLWVS